MQVLFALHNSPGLSGLLLIRDYDVERLANSTKTIKPKPTIIILAPATIFFVPLFISTPYALMANGLLIAVGVFAVKRLYAKFASPVSYSGISWRRLDVTPTIITHKVDAHGCYSCAGVCRQSETGCA